MVTRVIRRPAFCLSKAQREALQVIEELLPEVKDGILAGFRRQNALEQQGKILAAMVKAKKKNNPGETGHLPRDDIFINPDLDQIGSKSERMMPAMEAIQTCRCAPVGRRYPASRVSTSG